MVSRNGVDHGKALLKDVMVVTDTLGDVRGPIIGPSKKTDGLKHVSLNM
jgi:hypothetical protein